MSSTPHNPPPEEADAKIENTIIGRGHPPQWYNTKYIVILFNKSWRWLSELYIYTIPKTDPYGVCSDETTFYVVHNIVH